MKPIILNVPESMTRVRVVTLRDDTEPALKALHRVGVLHVEEGKELAPVDRVAVENQQKEVSELRAFVSSMLSYIAEKEQVELGEDVEVIYTRPFGEITREVRSLYADFAELSEKTARINREKEELTEQRNYLGALSQYLDVRVKDLGFSGDYLFSRVFVLSDEAYEGLRDELGKYLFESTPAKIDGETVLYALGKMSSLEAVESLIGGAGGEALLLPDEDLTLREFLKKSEDRISELEGRLAELYEGQGMLDRAIYYLRQVCASGKKKRWSHYQLVLLLKRTGHALVALSEAEKALELYRDFAELALFAGNVAFAEKLYSRAERHYKLAAKLGSPSAVVGLENIRVSRKSSM